MNSEIIDLKISSIKKILANKHKLEEKLKVKIESRGGSLTISGEEVDLYLARRIIESISQGFEINIALLLLDEDYTLETIYIKEETRKKYLERIRGRVIGRQGKTLKILSDLSDSYIVLHENIISIIGPFEKIKIAENAVKSLIHGSKQANVYSYLEQARTKKNKF